MCVCDSELQSLVYCTLSVCAPSFSVPKGTVHCLHLGGITVSVLFVLVCPGVGGVKLNNSGSVLFKILLCHFQHNLCFT